MNRTAPRVPRHHHRSGFSLLELLAAIVIIAILISLLFPAIGAVRRRAQITRVSAEMTQFEQAIASFKALYGVEPPSSLHVPATGGTWNAADQSKVRSIWPQFNFSNRGGLDSAAPPIPELHLNGAECLVFFLGGRSTGGAGQAQMLGFSKNPETPWSDAGQNREGPFFQFDAGRLVDVDGDSVLLEYVDPLPNQKTPYLFLSSQGKNYHAANATGTPGTLSTYDDFDVHVKPSDTSTTTNPNPNMTLDLQSIYTKAGNQPHRPNGYQIISPGLDGQYGVGGLYTSSGDVDTRKTEQDNITNFAGGSLQ
jgi:prepilin-type N-terminal cleavage/methylation domain-containing protein